ncbi:hypothetical protein AUR64_15595 [Haloprofundus marisrubri]|uniref:DUF63 domain-containing protein n=1 Tax=Haloprofundus marisrubri TaxID=1514971 RepID=A0A0W1R7F1_9EURY|nr:DUF63 family protein [Haloprofundus marisrubri]KTG09215.1 hypothetical protein AUR64_15595 [Haloprofundus marisrubri]
MQVLPEGFALPPLPYLLALVVGLAAVGYAFYRRRPALTDRHVLALAPWMVTGSALHVAYALGVLPAVVDPLMGTPSVYLTVGVVAGGVWVVADALNWPVPTALAVTGVVAAIPAVGLPVSAALAAGSFSPFWSTVALVVSLVLAAVAWTALKTIRPETTVTHWAGALAVFGHTLDGVSTAVGLDVLSFGERTPLSRLIFEFAAELPTADIIGTGWLFVLVKLLLAGFVVSIMADYVREEPSEGLLLLTLVAAVGLGPGVHNLILFAVA